MQTIKHEQLNIHPIFDEIERFYQAVSEKSNQSLIAPVFDYSFQELQDLFNSFTDTDFNFNFINKPFTTVKLPRRRKKNIIICFSGGKDSLAVVLYYMQLGYNVYLYHLKHINPPLYDEVDRAIEIAKVLDLPIYVDTVKLSGKHDYIEHPMKNMIIANGALQYGIKEKIGTDIAFGNYSTSTVYDDNFEYCGGDDIETWRVYEKIIQRIIPKFKMHLVLSSLADTLEIVCHNKELLEMSVSCLGRASMRNYWHDWVKNKFEIILPKYRCGRCYKCCIEYIYMTDHELQEYNEEYYKYCFNNLKKNFDTETGIKHNDLEVWDHYFFYDIKESQCYGKCG